MVAVLQCGPDDYPVALPSLGDRGAHSNRETSKPVITSFSEPDRHICLGRRKPPLASLKSHAREMMLNLEDGTRVRRLGNGCSY